VNLFDRVGAALDAVWAAIDPDEPVLCDCRGGYTCSDCALAAPIDTVADWAAPVGTAVA